MHYVLSYLKSVLIQIIFTVKYNLKIPFDLESCHNILKHSESFYELVSIHKAAHFNLQ